MTDKCTSLLILSFRECDGEEWEEGIEKYRSIHHPDFYDLHRKRIECHDSIGERLRSHDGEEDGIDFEKYDIQKECYSIWQRNPKDMADILAIPSESDFLESVRVPPCQSCHEDISCESCDHDERELLCMLYR